MCKKTDTVYRKIGRELGPHLSQFYNSPALSVEPSCIRTVFMIRQTDPVSENRYKERDEGQCPT